MHNSHSAQYSIIFGLGQTGLSCVRYCHEKNIPMKVVDTGLKSSDLIDFQNNFPGIELYLGALTPSDFESILEKAHQIIVSPGVYIKEHPILLEAKAREIPLIGDVELFARACQKPYAAITGSNGKTTVTTLVGKLIEALGLKVGVGGNIGTPALDLLKEECEVYVLELSSFQLDTTDSLKATVATILNITPDHLDRYDSYSDYIKSKQKILENAHIIIPESTLTPPKEGGFGVVSYQGQEWLAFNDSQNRLCPFSDFKLVGSHNSLNIISALALVHALGIFLGYTWEAMKGPCLEVLKTFQGLDHRCQWIASFKGVTWINDSKGTNIGASLAALQSMVKQLPSQGKLILIAGGEGKNQDFEMLKAGIDPLASKIRQILLIGKDAQVIQEALGSQASSICLETLSQAVELASQQAKEGDIVLLSPCCSSLDQYSSYVARGQDFIQAVNHYSTGNR